MTALARPLHLLMTALPMSNLGRRRQLLCVVGRDEASRQALLQARGWQQAFGLSVRVVLVSDAVAAPDESANFSRFQTWAGREAGLDLSAEDVFGCSGQTFSVVFQSAVGSTTDLVVCSGAPDCATELGTVSLRGLWHRTAESGAALFVARDARPPRRILVATDGTSRTLPVLKLAFDLGERLDAQLSYFDSLRIPIHHGRATKVAGQVSLRPAELEPSQVARYLRAVYGIAGAMARAGKDHRADLVLVGVAPGDHVTADNLFAALPCSVLAVPCPVPASLPTRLK